MSDISSIPFFSPVLYESGNEAIWLQITPLLQEGDKNK